MRLSEIDRPKDAAIDFGNGDVLNITYHASRLTPKLEEELGDASDTRQMIGLLLVLVSSWDLMEADGETVVPLTEERLATVPTLALSIVTRGISADIVKDVSAQGKA